MTDRPIIFSAPMVRALLEGRKTMTRRIAWKPLRLIGEGGFGRVGLLQDPSPWQRVQPGDRLWVRENWQSDVRNVGRPPRDVPRTEPVWFAAGGDPINSPGAFAIQATGWRPSIHMPRWASRLTLTAHSFTEHATDLVYRVGKHRAGATLEGREWREVPA